MSQGLTDLPFNLWTFLSLPSLYFAWSLLLLGLVLFFCLFAPGHQPFSWDVAILNIPVPVLSTGLSLLVTLIPCSLVARNFQVLSQAIELPTTPKPSESLKPMDLSSPSVLESTESVASEKVLGFVATAAHVILGYAFLYCRTENPQYSNLSRQFQSLLPFHRQLLQRSHHADFTHNLHHRGILCQLTAPASQSTTLGSSLVSFSVRRHLTFDQALTKRVLMLPVAFLALSALASLFGLLVWPTWRLLG